MSEEKKYDNTNKGTLYKNDNKKEKQPDYRGKINVNGIDFRISGWINKINDEDVINFLLVEEEEFQKRMAIIKAKQDSSDNHLNQEEPSPQKNEENNKETYDPVFDDIFKDLNF